MIPQKKILNEYYKGLIETVSGIETSIIPFLDGSTNKALDDGEGELNKVMDNIN